MNLAARGIQPRSSTESRQLAIDGDVSGLTELPRLMLLLASRATPARWGDGLEVDAVIEPRGGPVCAVEVKAAATLSPRDSRGLKSLAASLGDEFGAGVILHTGSEAVHLAPKIWALPLTALWA